MASASNNDSTPPLKSRAALIKKLNSEIPPGEEAAYLSSATRKLEASRLHLEGLREERGKIRREISIRERKRQDWKGKVPRPPGLATLSDAQAELSRCGVVMGHRVARMVQREGGVELKFFDMFKKGLAGLQGFDKLWVIAVGEGEETMEGNCCGGGEEGGVYLWLVDVVSVDVKEGVVQIAGVEFMAGVAIVDIKPYLPYCDAWPLDGVGGKEDNETIEELTGEQGAGGQNERVGV